MKTDTSGAAAQPASARPDGAVWPRLAAITSGVLCAALGLAVMVGWHVHGLGMLQIRDTFVAMVYNTALCFVLCGTALVAVASNRARAAFPSGVLTTLFGLLTVSEFVTGGNFGIDQLLMRSYVLDGNLHPGRMAINSAILFLIIGPTLLMRSALPRSSTGSLLTAVVGALTLGQGVVAISGYLTGVTTTYAWGTMTRMAAHTALGFAVLGTGLIALAWSDEYTLERTHSPRWLPLLVGVSGAAVTLCLWQSLLVQERTHIQREIEARILAVTNSIASHMTERMMMLQRLASRWEQDAVPNGARWVYDAGLLARDAPDFHAIGWVDTGGIVRWMVPVERNSQAIGLDLASDERRRSTLNTAMTTQRLALSQPLDLATGGKGFLALIPIVHDGHSFGYVNGVFRINTVIDNVLADQMTDGFSLSIAADDQEIYQHGEARLARAWGRSATLRAPIDAWSVTLWPNTDTLRRLQSWAPAATLLFGLLLSTVLAWATRLIQVTRRHADSVNAASLVLKREVSTRERAESALATVLEKERALAENAVDVICSIDSEGAFVSVSPASFSAWGYHPEELVGRRYIELVAEEDVGATNAAAASIMAGQSVTNLLNHYRHRNGAYVPMIWSAAWVPSQQLMFCVARDDSARALVEQALREGEERFRTESSAMAAELAVARDAALESVRLKSEFLATMSHEIRTPMNGVVGMTELLLLTELSEEQREYTNVVLQSADALLTIINDILDFSKIESGKMQLEIIDFVLRTTLEETAALLAERAQSKGLEMACLIHHAIPVVVRGDPGRLRQILTNLLGNAIKFTESGEVVVRASLASDDGDEVTVRIEIRDTGIGISAEGKERLFQSFSQADGSTTRRFGGTGLGLAISKRLAELMGGDIGVESSPGQGSTFWFTVKLGTIPAHQFVVPAQREDLQGLRVLAVDDNKTNLQLVQTQTRAWGMSCDTARGGAEALQLIAACAGHRPYDLAIIDVQMPGMDGLELARLLKADPANAAMKLIVMTSVGRRGHASQSAEAGVSGYLNKPIRQSELYDCLRTVTGGSITDATQSAAAAPKIVTAHSLKEARSLRRPRVLLAEDNQTNQMATVRMLEKLGFQVDVAVNGREAVEACGHVEYGLVLMDNQMPEMDGRAATRLIRSAERAGGYARNPLPIIGLTADAMQGDREKCLAAGMNDYMSKPFKLAQLSDMLDRWLPSPQLAVPALDAEPNVPPPGAVDASVLEAFVGADGSGHDFVLGLIDRYLAETTARLTSLHVAVDESDLGTVVMDAHSMKGTSSTVGANRLAALCGDLEVLARNAVPDGSQELVSLIDGEFALVKSVLRVQQLRT